MNAVFLAMACVLYTGSISSYGEAIEYETSDWSRNPITDLSATCPTNQEPVKGVFNGLYKICQQEGSYFIGNCNRRGGKDVDGMDEVTLSRFNGVYICVKKDTSLNYHSLMTQRPFNSICQSGFTKCGSPSDTNKQYCLKSCPPNSIQVTTSNLSSDYGTNRTFYTTWNGYYNSYNKSNSLISQIIISLSKPCGNGMQAYQVRQQPIELMYKEVDECTYDNNGQKVNSLYHEIGFDSNEFAVYNLNKILTILKNTVPDYNEDSLKKNSYRFYYKTYSLWTQQCQQQYSTEDIAELGKNTGMFSKLYLGIFIVTITLYGWQFLYNLFNLCIHSCCGKHWPECLDYFLFGLFEIACYITLIVLYAITVGLIREIDTDKIKYIHDNQCSDEVLQHSFDIFYTSFDRDISMVYTGLAFVLASFVLRILSYWFFLDARKYCCSCIKSSQDKQSDKIAKADNDYANHEPSQFVKNKLRTLVEAQEIEQVQLQNQKADEEETLKTKQQEADTVI